jgi:[ribosomal protein S18]-alanine N-acetyltransferase
MTRVPLIQIGSVDDLDQIMPIMAAAFSAEFGEAWTKEQCNGMLGLPGTSVFLAKDEGRELSGFAIARHVHDEAELLLIAVDPSKKRYGIGKMLLRECCAWAKSFGAKKLFLEVRDGNPALIFYRNVDFVQVGARSNYYRGQDGRQYDAVTLAKNLQD